MSVANIEAGFTISGGIDECVYCGVKIAQSVFFRCAIRLSAADVSSRMTGIDRSTRNGALNNSGKCNIHITVTRKINIDMIK